MDNNQSTSLQDSVDMSISSDEDGFVQQKEGNMDLAHDHDEAQREVLLQDPELGMTFDNENDVREYYKNYAKSKGFGVMKRSSHTDDDGELKYVTLCCSRYGKTRSNSKKLLKPNPSAGLGCKAKIQAVVYLDNQTSSSTLQESYDFGIGTGNITPAIADTISYGVMQDPFEFGTSPGNINPMITTPVPPGGSSTMVMPPILGKYTSLLFEVQQSSAAVSSSTAMQFDGDGELENRMNHS